MSSRNMLIKISRNQIDHNITTTGILDITLLNVYISYWYNYSDKLKWV